MAEPKDWPPRDAADDAWIEEQLKGAPRLSDDPERAARIARVLGLGREEKGDTADG